MHISLKLTLITVSSLCPENRQKSENMRLKGIIALVNTLQKSRRTKAQSNLKIWLRALTFKEQQIVLEKTGLLRGFCGNSSLHLDVQNNPNPLYQFEFGLFEHDPTGPLLLKGTRLFKKMIKRLM